MIVFGLMLGHGQEFFVRFIHWYNVFLWFNSSGTEHIIIKQLSKPIPPSSSEESFLSSFHNNLAIPSLRAMRAGPVKVSIVTGLR